MSDVWGPVVQRFEALWGVYDTEDQCWIGDDKGPKLFEDEALAKVCAQIVDVQLRQGVGRCRARQYDGSGTKFKDEKPTAMDTLTALKRLEDGYF